jgi:hypothetical protein
MERTKTLIQTACEKLLPPLYSTDGDENAPFKVKIVAPFANFEWWLKEYDIQNRLAFGFACLNDPYNAELGYISIVEIEEELLKRGVLVLLDDTYEKCLTWEEIKTEVHTPNRKPLL